MNVNVNALVVQPCPTVCDPVEGESNADVRIQCKHKVNICWRLQVRVQDPQFAPTPEMAAGL